MSEEGRWPEVPLIFNDLPLEGDEEAHFQFKAYAFTFARLIASKHTRTPLTIGIHSDWGSGKTTLMQLIRARLDETRPQHRKKGEQLSFLSWEESAAKVFPQRFRTCETVWFNAGKYGREDALRGGVSPYTVHDMAGNVWEWTASEHEDASGSRVLRGGSWYFIRYLARCAYRLRDYPYFVRFSYGFRVVVSPISPPSGL